MKLITNIHQLLVTGDFPSPVSGAAMKSMPYIENAYLLIDEGIIYDFGKMEDMHPIDVDEVMDVSGQVILPAWCDSHTHLVFAQGREQEFVDRINGLTYEQIAERGGGILNSVEKLRTKGFEELYEESAQRLEQLIELGTGAIEIKSGYGLSFDSEKKILEVVKQLKKEYDIPISATLLAAHAVPKEYAEDREGYVTHIIEDMIPAFAKADLAQHIDIFCEKGYFTVEDMERILAAGNSNGLTPKVHVNQFNSIGGIATAVKYNALSVDHLEVLTEKDIEALKGSSTMPVALPGCSYFINIPYTPARTLIDAGLPLAIASDYNPGSAPSGNMNFVVSQACINLKITPEEAIIAATINGAYAMGLQNEVGSISKGKKANLIITKPTPHYHSIPYQFGMRTISQVLINGELK